MFSNYTIIPNEGLDEIKFGVDMDSFVEKFGEPEEIDSIDEDEECTTTVLHYWGKGVSIFFAGNTNPVLAGIETDNPKSMLYGEEVMGKSKENIIALMEKNGQSNYEAEDEEYSGDNNGKDLRVSFDESMMDFFFRDKKLVYMNFGVFVDENGNIEKV